MIDGLAVADTLALFLPHVQEHRTEVVELVFRPETILELLLEPPLLRQISREMVESETLTTTVMLDLVNNHARRFFGIPAGGFLKLPGVYFTETGLLAETLGWRGDVLTERSIEHHAGRRCSGHKTRALNPNIQSQLGLLGDTKETENVFELLFS